MPVDQVLFSVFSIPTAQLDYAYVARCFSSKTGTFEINPQSLEACLL